nr:putative ankyrin repeat protein [Megavirus caiporensis]
MIRVGRCVYDKKGKRTDPSYDGFTPIIVLMKSHSPYGVLGPYVLKDDKDRIMESIWQFSKVYQEVPATTQRYSRYDQTIIWSHPKEKHVDDAGNILPAYWTWREKGMNNKYYVRYPVGFHNMSKCIFAIKESDIGPNKEITRKLDYIEGRKEIYGPVYCELVKKEPMFDQLKKRLESGENLLIIEVDGPHQESLHYYMEKYHVSDNFIEDSTMLVTDENLAIMLHDAKHPFGHGYCLAMALTNNEWLMEL